MIKKHIKKLFIFSVSVLTFIFNFTLNTKAATDGSYRFVSPNSGNLVEGCTYSLDLRVNAGSNNSNSADVIILYNSSQIDIIDSLFNISGTQIKPGSAYELYFGNEVNSSTGMIRLTGASFSQFFTGEDRFATIEFKSKPGVSSSSFTIKFDGASETNTLDSNIAIAETSLDALGSVTNVNLNFSAGTCISDTVPPVINFINPVNNQSNVPIDQNIEINITDNLSGVDLSKLIILVNGIPYTVEDPEVQITGNPNNYTIIINPRDNFYPNSPSSIVVTATDYAANSNQSNISFNFSPVITTPQPSPTTIPSPTVTVSPTITQPSITPTPVISTLDIISPGIGFITPVSRETIGNSSPIKIRLTDSGSGVNLDTLKILINERVYNINDFVVNSTGNPNEYLITITDNFNFSPYSSSYMTVFISDSAGNSSVNNIIFNIPKAELSDPEKFCEEVTGGSNQPVKDAPLKNTIETVQKNIENSVPESIKPIVKETGVLGLASLVAASPLVIWGISLLGSFLAGGFLFPFLIGLFALNRRQYGLTIDNISKEKVSLVKIEVFNKKTLQFVQNAVSNFSGKFFIDLKAGDYILEFTKKGFETLKVDVYLDKDSRLTNIIELNRFEAANIADDFQFKTLKIDPRIMSIYFSLIFAFLNMLYTRSIVSIIILGITTLLAIIVPRKIKKKL